MFGQPKRRAVLPRFLRSLKRRRRRSLHTHSRGRVDQVLYKDHREYAVSVLVDRVHVLSLHCGLVAKRVTVKDHRRRWGSCSSLGNVNLNYRLAYVPPCVRDYVIIHELCHLVELNHGEAFWKLVQTHFPEEKQARIVLRHLEKETALNLAKIKQCSEIHQFDCEYCQNSIHKPSSIVPDLAQ